MLRKKFAGDAIWLLVAQVVMMGTNLVANILISTSFGNDVLGVFNQGLAFLLLMSTLVGLGMNSSITKHTASETHWSGVEVMKNRLIMNVFFTLLVSLLFLTAFLMIAINFTSWFSSEETRAALIIVACSIPLFAINKNYLAFLVGQRKQKQFALLRTLRWTTVLLVVTMSCFYFKESNYCYYSFLVSEIILLSVVVLNVFGTKFRWEFDTLKQHIFFGLKSYVSEVISISSERLDILLVGYFLTNSEVGVYSFVVFFAKSLYLIPSILMQSINPIISKVHRHNKLRLLNPFLSTLAKRNFMLVSIQLVGVVILYYFITLFFKEEFQGTFYLLLIAIAGTYLYSFIHWLGAALVMTGHLRINFYRTGIILIVNASILLLMIHFYGLIGAFCAITIGAVINFTLVYFMLKQYLGVQLFKRTT